MAKLKKKKQAPWIGLAVTCEFCASEFTIEVHDRIRTYTELDPYGRPQRTREGEITCPSCNQDTTFHYPRALSDKD